MIRRALRGPAAVRFVILALLLALSVGGAASGSGNGKHNGSHNGTHGRIGFHFLVLDTISGTSDRLIFQGNGSFNRNRASGGGTFDHFQATGSPPLPLTATGTWKAQDVVSWTPGLTHGVYQGGILVIHATLRPAGRPAIKHVLVEIDCNLGPAGFSTGKPEGVVVTIPGTPPVVFTPTTPTAGLTVFSLTKGHKH
jgi:hypothetical protein